MDVQKVRLDRPCLSKLGNRDDLIGKTAAGIRQRKLRTTVVVGRLRIFFGLVHHVQVMLIRNAIVPLDEVVVLRPAVADGSRVVILQVTVGGCRQKGLGRLCDVG